MSATASSPIGVFDSGLGGLTVYRALRAALPHEDFVYLGDTAHLPYGTKSAGTVAQYALEAACFLQEQGVKLLVTACHTVSAQALPVLHEKLPGLPCLGVIAPSLEAAVRASRTGRIAVLATEGTVRSDVYPEMLRALRPGAEVEMLAAGRLVELAEEGLWEGDTAEAIAGGYLNRLKPGFDTLVLGCTHFPLLTPTIRKLIPPGVTIIDSAEAVARVVADFLSERNLLNPQAGANEDRFFVTDEPECFSRLAGRILNRHVVAKTAAIMATAEIAPSGMKDRGR